MAIQGALPVEFGTVFPHGVFALGVEAVTNFETKRPEVDREAGLPLWAVEVIDADPNARGKAKSVKVKVAAEVCPTLPDEVAGLPFRPLSSGGLLAAGARPEGSRRWCAPWCGQGRRLAPDV